MSNPFKPRFVECVQRREGGTRVDFPQSQRWPAGNYLFTTGHMIDGRHAAEITEEAHYERLISLPEGFRPVHTDDLLQAPAVPKLVAPAQAVVAAPAPAQTTDTTPDTTPDANDANADVWDANKVLALGVNKIIALVKSFTDEQLRELLEIESARQDPRESLQKSLAGTLRNRAA